VSSRSSLAIPQGLRPEESPAGAQRRSLPARRLPAQRTFAWAALAGLVSAVLVAGWWGITADRGSHEEQSAAIGEAVAIPGGLVRVDRATYEASMSMATSGPGMSMPMSSAPGTALPEPKKGYRRLNVDVTLYAKSPAGLRFRPESFRVGAPGGKASGLVGIDRGPSRLPGGTALSRNLAFDVPSSARNVVLTVAGAEKPIQLVLGPAPSGGHGHTTTTTSTHQHN